MAQASKDGHSSALTIKSTSITRAGRHAARHRGGNRNPNRRSGTARTGTGVFIDIEGDSLTGLPKTLTVQASQAVDSVRAEMAKWGAPERAMAGKLT